MVHNLVFYTGHFLSDISGISIGIIL